MDIDFVLNKIYDFCQVKEKSDYYVGETFRKTPEYSNRLNFLIKLVKELGIEHEVHTMDFDDYYLEESLIYFHNLILKGSSKRWISAHYDVFNEDSQNANDNSASVINAIATKFLNPEINVVLLDAEEQPFVCQGTKNHIMYLMTHGDRDIFNIDFILNLELTGLGQKILVENKYGNLLETIRANFDVMVMDLPKNDSHYFRKKCIDSICVSTAPMIDGEINFDHFRKCHKEEDNLESISINDMKEFVLNFLVPLSKG